MEKKKVESVVVGLDALVDYIREKDDIIQHFNYLLNKKNEIIEKKEKHIQKLYEILKENGLYYVFDEEEDF